MLLGMAAVVLIATAGCVPQDAVEAAPTEAAVQTYESSGPVTDGSAVEVSLGDAVTVTLPEGASTGTGTLSVAARDDAPDEWSGWTIGLEGGASLTGEATIRFHNLRGEDKETPPPLVFSAETEADQLLPAGDVTWDGNDAVVSTTHFSNWFTRKWDSFVNGARQTMDAIFSEEAQGKQPSCPNEDVAREYGLEVRSSDGNRVLWCAGITDEGEYVLKITNPRGYAVAVEESPGMQLTNEDDTWTNAIPRLFSSVYDEPRRPGSTMHLLPGGGTYEYLVTHEDVEAVEVYPSAGATHAQALMFGVSTLLQFVPQPKSMDPSKQKSNLVILEAMKAAGCGDGLVRVKEQDELKPAPSADTWNLGLSTVMGCLDEALDVLWSQDGASGIAFLNVFSWFIDAVYALSNSVYPLVDRLLHLDLGYQVAVTRPVLTSADFPGFPAEIQGEWCTKLDGAERKCFSLYGLADGRPGISLEYALPADSIPGATDYKICINDGSGDVEASCSTAASVYLTYFPAGVAWDCNEMNGFEMNCGDPDYSESHDVSAPRLVQQYNHQQDMTYHDSPPMYRQ